MAVGVFKSFIQGGILGALAYYIVDFVLSTLITGTDSVTTFFTTIMPLAVAFGVVWFMIAKAFSSSND